MCTLFAEENFPQICRQEHFFGATWINCNPHYHTKLLSTSNLKLYPKVTCTSVRIVRLEFLSAYYRQVFGGEAIHTEDEEHGLT